MEGWHVCRHAFVSALVAWVVDQRIVEELAGHMDEKTSRRYRHIAPNIRKDALRGGVRLILDVSKSALDSIFDH